MELRVRCQGVLVNICCNRNHCRTLKIISMHNYRKEIMLKDAKNLWFGPFYGRACHLWHILWHIVPSSREWRKLSESSFLLRYGFWSPH